MNDIGDYRVTYPIARHFLVFIKSAHKLAEIEHHSPHIKGDDAEIWQKLIREKFPDWETKNYEPEDEEGIEWYDVYMRYQEEEEQKLEAAKAILKQSYGAAMGHQRENTSKKVEARFMPKLPRDPKLLANAGIPLSRRNYSGNNTRPRKVGFLGPAGTGLKQRRNMVEQARKEAAAQVAMRKQGQRYDPNAKTQIKKAPAGLIEQHEAEDRQKRLALPPMPVTEQPKRVDPYEARVATLARSKRLQEERASREKQLQKKKKEEEESKEMADLFGDEGSPEKAKDSRSSTVQLPGGGTARKLPVKNSPTLGPAKPRAPPKKVDIFYAAKKKPFPPPTALKSDTTSTATIPNLNHNAPRNAFTTARPAPPRMTSMAQGARGAINPAGTKKSRQAVEMKSMRPVNAVTDRQSAGRSAAATPSRPTPFATRPPQAKITAVSQPRSGGGVTSMLAGLVAKQDAERAARPSPSLKRSAPTESSAAKRIHAEPTQSRPSTADNSRTHP